MCGIAGIFSFGEAPIEQEEIKRMCSAIAHRGPDDEGFYLKGRVGLGMRRLSIIDLATGHQPVHNEDGSVWVVFNGEIYNFIDLRRDLERRGHAFYTSTDTEVIAHLYEEYGARCVEPMRGMFTFAVWDARRDTLLISSDERGHAVYTSTDTEVIAHLYEEYGARCVEPMRGMFTFAVWDARRDTLLLGRDRLGVKPLYYAESGGRLLFASELKSLLELSDIERRLDPRALSELLTSDSSSND